MDLPVGKIRLRQKAVPEDITESRVLFRASGRASLTVLRLGLVVQKRAYGRRTCAQPFEKEEEEDIDFCRKRVSMRFVRGLKRAICQNNESI